MGQVGKEYIIEPERKIPVRGKFDVIVVGGGSAGIGSAIAAARNGARTLLIEKYGFLGGMLTAALVIGIHTDKLIPLEKFGETKPLLGGIANELLARLIAVGGAVEPSVWLKYTKCRPNYIPTDPELLKIVTQKMVREAGAELLYHSLGVGAIVEQKRVKGIFIENKSGREALLADIVVDATGDGDIAASAGAAYDISDKALPMTMMAILGNVDLEKAREYYPGSPALKEIVSKAIEQGFARESVLPERPVAPALPIRFVYLPPGEEEKYWQRAGETHGWAANFRGNCTDIKDLNQAEIETKEKLLPLIEFLRANVAGYEKCYLLASGPQVGTRESRRIIGDYVLTLKQDIDQSRKHVDNICRGRRNRGDSLHDADPAFDIPYRCLYPREIDGLVVSGRCISIDHPAGLVIAIRDGIQTLGIGQAAGAAAALAAQGKVQPRELNVGLLQDTLVSQGMNLRD
jgi:2-polyprenyl-6-methoxyphenol hydroxylase-like FAD-dependent oxidoreductase